VVAAAAAAATSRSGYPANKRTREDHGLVALSFCASALPAHPPPDFARKLLSLDFDPAECNGNR
jgi:hypothetical protein